MTEQIPRAGAEATRLVAAAQDWLRVSAPHLAPVDADGTPCSCPLCRGVAVLRDADPEVVGRWVDVAVATVEQAMSQARSAASTRAPDAPEAPSAQDTDPRDEDAASAATPRRVRTIPLDGRGDPQAAG